MEPIIRRKDYDPNHSLCETQEEEKKTHLSQSTVSPYDYRASVSHHKQYRKKLTKNAEYDPNRSDAYEDELLSRPEVPAPSGSASTIPTKLQSVSRELPYIPHPHRNRG